MIKAVAFDLARVFIKIKDIELNSVEDLLSRTFDYEVEGKLYWDWAQEKTGLGKDELEKISWDTINKLYEVREPDIFEKLPKLKFATASNHLSMIKEWFKEKGMYDKFYCHVISQDIHFMKPSREFYNSIQEHSAVYCGDELNADMSSSFGGKPRSLGRGGCHEALIEKLGENPEDILFVDDKEDNIEGAKRAGLKTLLYDGQKLLSESILEKIK